MSPSAVAELGAKQVKKELEPPYEVEEAPLMSFDYAALYFNLNVKAS